jgi:hypothetical protein
MNTNTDAPDAAEKLRYVFVARPRCPACNSLKVTSYRTLKNGDGSLTRYAKCRDCRWKFLVVVD